jgi:altronate dehydratase large subunit
MDTPGHDIEQMTGMVAGGCHIIVFTTGRGTCCGSAIVPTIKVATNTALYEKMKDNMDMDAGTVVTGAESVREVGERIFAELLQVASGRASRAEILGFNDFAIRRIGPSL